MLLVLICRTLTLKMPRKTASENVCLCRLLNILANFSKLFFAYRQTVWTQIRLLLKEQSDLGPHCLQKWLLKSQADDKADDNSCDWHFKVNGFFTISSYFYLQFSLCPQHRVEEGMYSLTCRHKYVCVSVWANKMGLGSYKVWTHYEQISMYLKGFFL